MSTDELFPRDAINTPEVFPAREKSPGAKWKVRGRKKRRKEGEVGNAHGGFLPRARLRNRGASSIALSCAN